MAEYLILIYADEASAAALEREQPGETTAAHLAFMQRNRDVLRGGSALQPTTTATSVRRDRPGSVIVTDGAFAETKEALGGYYLIEAADLDAALAVAEQVPARFGGVEVRPVKAFGRAR